MPIEDSSTPLRSYRRFTVATVAVVAALAIGGAIAQADGGQTSPKGAVAPKAKISEKQAQAIAVKKIGGKLVSSKYEFEDGRWQYAVLVNDKKSRLYEVEINATSGKIEDMEKTTLADEAREDAEDKKASSHSKKAPEKEDKADEKN